jgi:hypothetical protein
MPAINQDKIIGHTKRLKNEEFPLRRCAFASQISRKVAETQRTEIIKFNEKHSIINLFAKMALVWDSQVKLY